MIKFDITYWQPQQFSAVADGVEVIYALTEYINSDASESGKARAAKALLALSQDREPDDLGIIARALRHTGFTGDRSEPESVDECTDYTAEVRRS